MRDDVVVTCMLLLWLYDRLRVIPDVRYLCCCDVSELLGVNVCTFRRFSRALCTVVDVRILHSM